MINLKPYIEGTLGLNFVINPLPDYMQVKFPLFLRDGYTWYISNLNGRECIMAEINNDNSVTIATIENHFNQVTGILGLPVVGIFPELEAFVRKRLITKRIAFVVPNKQLYIPFFFVDIKEYTVGKNKVTAKLTPVGQLLLLYQILNRANDFNIEQKTFKELAENFGSNAMAITRAVDNLRELDVCTVVGVKEKFIRFQRNKADLWHFMAERELWINPVLKRIYVDELPDHLLLSKSNTSALPEYSDMNPSRQEFYAIEKSMFYGIQKSGGLVNANEYEGRYCLEVWKYNPEILVKGMHNNISVVDPLSLYLSLRESSDERIEMALEQIKERYIW